MKYVLAAAGAAALSLLVLFFGYGWSQGHDPVRALGNSLTPHPDPVESNPDLPVIAKHRVSWLGDIESRELQESSGLTASIRHEDVLWSMNDSGGEAELFAMSLTGKHLATVSIATEKPIDWESLDAFEYEGKSYVAIADVGDNFGWRSSVRVLVVPEPELIESGDVDVAWTIEFTYPDGPRDSEAIAVDAACERILVLSKREYPQKLYEVPLIENDPEPTQAKLLDTLPGLPQPSVADYEEEPDTAQYRHMPSGMDYDPKTDQLLLTTYKHAFLYSLRELKKGPTLIPMPKVGQREAITWTGSNTAVVSRERKGGVGASDLFQIEIIRH